MNYYKTRNSQIKYYDPYVPVLNYNSIKVESIDSLSAFSPLDEFDAFVILTDHSNVDYHLILDYDAPIIDTETFLIMYQKIKL